MSLADDLQQALRDTNVQAFLRVIRAGETSQNEDAYRTLVGGEKFDDLSQHPGKSLYLKNLALWSTAAGAYQFLRGTWKEVAAACSLPDFSPESQDLGAVYLIRRRKALDDVLAGRIEQAIVKCAKEWASLPGSPYGQPTRTLQQALTTYSAWGGQFHPAGEGLELPKLEPELLPDPVPAAVPIPFETESPMLPALLLALLPSLVEHIPKLATIFKPGSEVAERNVKAAAIAFDIAKEAINATNEQDVVEQLKSSPAAVAAVQAAVEERWFELSEAGGGGIEGARQADAKIASTGDLLKSPSFYIAVLLLPLVYLIVGAVVGLWGAPFSDDVRSAIANGIVGMIIGAVIGYYFGQMTSRNRA